MSLLEPENNPVAFKETSPRFEGEATVLYCEDCRLDVNGSSVLLGDARHDVFEHIELHTNRGHDVIEATMVADLYFIDTTDFGDP